MPAPSNFRSVVTSLLSTSGACTSASKVEIGSLLLLIVFVASTDTSIAFESAVFGKVTVASEL